MFSANPTNVRWSRPLFALLLTSCATTGLNGSTAGVCPDAATVPAPPPAWHRAGRSGVELALSYSLTQAIIQKRVNALFPATGDYGPEIQAIGLEQRTRNGALVNQVAIRFGVFFRKTDGTTTSLPGRNYTLHVEIAPDLITAATIPDASQRKTLLHCAPQSTCDSGVVLNFYYSELDGGQNFAGKSVDCHSTGFDFIDQYVLSTVYNLSTTWPPLALPMDGLLQFVKDMTKRSTTITAVDLGSNQALKLGLQLDQGGTNPFVPDAYQFSHFTDADWLLTLNTGLISSSIASNVVSAVSQVDSSLSITTPGVTFAADGIEITGSGSKNAGTCGTVPFGFEYTATPKVCRRNQSSVVGVCVDATQPPAPHYTGAAQEACVGIGSFFSGLFGQGVATAIVTTPCEEKGYLNFPLVDDVLYATGISTDGQFLVVGRSQNMDASTQPPRQSLPPQCQ